MIEEKLEELSRSLNNLTWMLQNNPTYIEGFVKMIKSVDYGHGYDWENKCIEGCNTLNCEYCIFNINQTNCDDVKDLVKLVVAKYK